MAEFKLVSTEIHEAIKQFLISNNSNFIEFVVSGICMSCEEDTEDCDTCPLNCTSKDSISEFFSTFFDEVFHEMSSTSSYMDALFCGYKEPLSDKALNDLFGLCDKLMENYIDDFSAIPKELCLWGYRLVHSLYDLGVAKMHELHFHEKIMNICVTYGKDGEFVSINIHRENGKATNYDGGDFSFFLYEVKNFYSKHEYWEPVSNRCPDDLIHLLRFREWKNSLSPHLDMYVGAVEAAREFNCQHYPDGSYRVSVEMERIGYSFVLNKLICRDCDMNVWAYD